MTARSQQQPAASSQLPATSSQSSQSIIWTDEGINNETVCVANNEPKRDRNQIKKYMDSEGAVFTHTFKLEGAWVTSPLT